MKKKNEEEGQEGDEPKIEDFDEEKENEEMKKMKKVKEVSYVWCNSTGTNSCGLERPCDHAGRRGVFPTVKVPQIQFIAGVCGPSCCATETGYALCTLCSWLRGAAYGGGGGDEGGSARSSRFWS